MNITLVAISLMVLLAVVLLVPSWLNHRSRAQSLKIIGGALKKGQPLDPAIVEKLTAQPPSAPVGGPAIGKWFVLVCLAVGVLNLSMGVALMASAALLGERISPDGYAGAGFLIGGVVNLVPGLGYLALGIVSVRLFSGRRRPSPKWDFASVLALICLFFGVGGLCVGTALAMSTLLLPEGMNPDGRAAAGMAAGALINLCAGMGMIVLGVVILRLFGERREG